MHDQLEGFPDADISRDFATGKPTVEQADSVSVRDLIDDMFRISELKRNEPENTSVKQGSDKHSFDKSGQIIHEPALDKNPVSSEQQLPEAKVTPEINGAPFADEVFGVPPHLLILGPEYPALNAKLESSDVKEREAAAWRITELKNEAIQKGAYWAGPLNERKKINIDMTADPIPVPEIDEVDEVDEVDEAPIEAKPVPLGDKEEGPELPPETEKKKNWLQQKWENLKNDLKGFDKFLTENRKDMHELSAYATIAGIASVSGAALAAEVALAMAAPPLLVPLVAFATGAYINYAGFTKRVKKWADESYNIDLENYDESKGDINKYKEKIALDRKYRMRTFAWADIVAKVAGGIGLGWGLSNARGEHLTAPENPSTLPNGEVPSPEEALPHLYGPNAIEDSGIGSHNPIGHVAPHIESPLTGNYTEYITTPNDTWDSLLGSEVVYSSQMIDVFKQNHDQIIEMWTKLAENNGHNAVPVKMGPDAQWEYWSVEKMTEKLDWLIQNGYEPGDPDVQAWIERLDYWVVPGQKIYLPTR